MPADPNRTKAAPALSGRSKGQIEQLLQSDLAGLSLRELPETITCYSVAGLGCAARAASKETLP